jgi:hypothetical protein
MLAEFGVELSYVVEVVDSETGVARSTDGRNGEVETCVDLSRWLAW